MKDKFGIDIEIGDFVVVAVYGTAFDPLIQRLGAVTQVFEDTCKVVTLNDVFGKMMPETSISMPSRIVKMRAEAIPTVFLNFFQPQEASGE
jgi:hypothetical protein